MAEKYDDVLLPFVSLMRKELHANAGKGDRPGWLAMSPGEALLEVYYHLAKLQKAVRKNDGPAIQEYSADVANMAMMVLDICGGLAWVQETAECQRLMGMSEPELDAELRAMGLEPDEAAERGRRAVEGALATIRASHSGVPVVVAANPSRDQGPCTVCGVPWAKHGTAPTCASHDYTPIAGVPGMDGKSK